MIAVAFKDNYENCYNTEKLYYYADKEGVEKGDIVVVNTKNGYAIAKVVLTDTFNENFDSKELNTIEKIILSEKERIQQLQEKKLREEQIQNLTKMLKQQQLISAVEKMSDLTILKDQAVELINSLTLEEINQINEILN